MSNVGRNTNGKKYGPAPKLMMDVNAMNVPSAINAEPRPRSPRTRSRTPAYAITGPSDHTRTARNGSGKISWRCHSDSVPQSVGPGVAVGGGPTVAPGGTGVAMALMPVVQ